MSPCSGPACRWLPPLPPSQLSLTPIFNLSAPGPENVQISQIWWMRREVWPLDTFYIGYVTHCRTQWGESDQSLTYQLIMPQHQDDEKIPRVGLWEAGDQHVWDNLLQCWTHRVSDSDAKLDKVATLMRVIIIRRWGWQSLNILTSLNKSLWIHFYRT